MRSNYFSLKHFVPTVLLVPNWITTNTNHKIGVILLHLVCVSDYLSICQSQFLTDRYQILHETQSFYDSCPKVVVAIDF